MYEMLGPQKGRTLVLQSERTRTHQERKGFLKSFVYHSDSYKAIESSSLSSLYSVRQCNHQLIIRHNSPFSCTINQAHRLTSIHICCAIHPYQSSHSTIHAFIPFAIAQPPSQCKPPNARIRTVVPTQSIRSAKRL